MTNGISYRGGKAIGSPKTRITTGVTYRGGKRIGVSPIVGVSVSKYRAVVPFMQASYVTAGMPGMTAKSIAMFTKAATMPSQLTHSERAFVRRHMPSMKPEYRKKFVEYERELTQAEMKEKVKKEKKKIQVGGIPRLPPGVATGLLYAATPATLKVMWAPKIPTIIKAGERVGIEAVKLKRWVSGEQPAPVRAAEAMLPSYVVSGEKYEKKATAFETKWASYTKGEYFTGTEVEHREYLGAHEEVRREGAQLERQQETFEQLETQAEREEKGRFWGLEEPHKREEKKAGAWIAVRTPTWEELLKKPGFKQIKTYKEWERTRIPKEVREIQKIDIHVRDYTKGIYEGLREKPLETLATAAVFAALPPVLKGAKYVAKVARFAPAAKWVQPISLTLKKGIPKVKRLEAVKVGVEKGILPSSAQFIPKVAGYGMGATYVGAMGYELYETPPSERAYKAGRMTATELAPMVIGTYVGVTAPSMVSGAARAARIVLLRKKIKMRDLTPEQIAAAKNEILYIEKGMRPSKFLESAYEAQYEYGMPTRHLTPGQYAKVRIKTGKLGGIYDITFPAERSEYLGMHFGPKIWKEKGVDVKASAEYWGIPSDIDPLKSQIIIAKGLGKARLKAQVRLGKQYIEFVAREKELPIITKEAREAWEYTHRKYGQIRAHELFHERYRTAPEERVVELEKQYAAARGIEKRMFPVGEGIEPGVKVWKMMDIDWGKETVIRRGHFEMPGGYVSPEAQPFFLRIGRQKPEWSLFGTEFPTPIVGARPTAMRITLEDIARLPKKVRETRDPYSMTAYALGKAEPGKAYVSWPIELGMKLESELVIAPTTGMKWTPSPTGKEYYTTWKRRAIPIEHYEWFKTGMERPEIGLEAGKYFVKRPRATAIIETERGIVLHPGERGEGLILPGGGIETAAEVAAKRGVRVIGEKAAEAAMREVHEELGVKTARISGRLFKYKSEEIPVYSRGRQKWYSKTYHDVFAVDIIGKPKPVSREVSKVVYWKPGSKMKLSKDTEAILKEYMAAKKRRVISKEPVTKERMREVVSRAEQRKERIKKGEPKTFEEFQKHQQLEYEKYMDVPKRAALISPLGLGIEYGIKKITRGPSYVPTEYREVVSKIAYPKYPSRAYPEGYVKYDMRKPARVAYPRRKPTAYPKPVRYPKPKPTKYPKPMKYPEPKPTHYPKLVPPPYAPPKYPPYAPPKYPPKHPPYVPPPPLKILIEEEPKRKKRVRTKRKSYAWRVKNPIPELQEMFAHEMHKRRFV